MPRPDPDLGADRRHSRSPQLCAPEAWQHSLLPLHCRLSFHHVDGNNCQPCS